MSDRRFAEFFPYLSYWLNHLKYSSVLKRVSGVIDFDKMRLSEHVVRRQEDVFSTVIKGEKKIRPSEEYALNIISAFSNEKRLSLLAVNILNKGLISGLPSEIAVEVPAVIDGRKIEGVSVKLLDAVKA